MSMLFNSISFACFFPVVVSIYYSIPTKARYIWLLVASYFFYMCWNVKYVILIAFSTVSTYIVACVIQGINLLNDLDYKFRIHLKRIILIGGIGLNLFILFLFKYYNFFVSAVSYVLSKVDLHFNINTIDLLLPVGISFYTFQVIGYIVDVYRGDVAAEKNILKYALFVSFFPQLVAGPIERSENLLKQINQENKFNYDSVRSGLLLMAWGYFEKIVVADRIAIIVDRVYSKPDDFYGIEILITTILFGIQIYGDFAGYTHIAIGAAEVMGFKLMNNFKQPYLANSIKEFWRRWHISLSGWFKDYLYIPLGGNRCSTLKSNWNLLITFIVSGLWHGAAIHYIVWGAINGAYQVIENCILKRCSIILRIYKKMFDNIIFKIISIFITFILVDFAWMFFRAEDLSEVMFMLRKIIGDGILYDLNIVNEHINMMGINVNHLCILGISIIILLIIDIIHEKGIHIRPYVLSLNLTLRWVLYIGIACFLLIILIQDFGVGASNFIYFQF